MRRWTPLGTWMLVFGAVIAFSILQLSRQPPSHLLLTAVPVALGLGTLLAVWRQLPGRSPLEGPPSQQLTAELDLRGAIVGNLAEGVLVVTARDGLIIYANQSLEKMLGYQEGELAGCHASLLELAEGTGALFDVQPILAELGQGRSWTREVPIRRKDGSGVWCRTKVSSFDHPIRGTLLVGLHTDVTEERQSRLKIIEYAAELETATQELQVQATHDSLTGAANHRCFHDRLSHEFERSRRYARPLALVLFDVDRFKELNDSHGHQAGDQVLLGVIERLSGRVRRGELVGRLGGDEFGVLLPETDSVAARIFAERVSRAIATDHMAGGEQVTVSAGVCDLSQAVSSEDMLKVAGTALFWAKTHGPNTVHVYSPDEARELSLSEREARLVRSQALAAIRALARAVDAKDPATVRHSERVADVAAALAEHMGWTQERSAQLREAALVHDVGKIGVSDSILFKPERLNADEYQEIKRHPALGAEIASEVLQNEQVDWIRGHHERPDGGGYPDGLKGEDIPLGARLLSLADAWDAMTIPRAYSTVTAPREAIEECRRQAGRQFFADAVAVLVEMYDSGTLPHLPIEAAVARRSRVAFGSSSRLLPHRSA